MAENPYIMCKECGESVHARRCYRSHDNSFNSRDISDAWQEGFEAAKKTTDAAYGERNKLVALVARLYPSSLERHPEAEEWEDDWRWIVFVDMPAGQVSWHIHDSELGLFAGVQRLAGRKWDGHTTEQKYERIAGPIESPGGE